MKQLHNLETPQKCVIIRHLLHERITLEWQLTFSLPVVKIVELFVFVGFRKSQRTNHGLHDLETVNELYISPMIKVAMAPLISDFRAHVLGICLDMSVKNGRVRQNS